VRLVHETPPHGERGHLAGVLDDVKVGVREFELTQKRLGVPPRGPFLRGE
jgi:hypothetical protein